MARIPAARNWPPGGARAAVPSGVRTLQGGRGAAGQPGAARPGRGGRPSGARSGVTARAAPLRSELELLARRGRLRLQAPPQQARAAEPDGPAAARSLGLTRRELEVLELVAAGRSNRQIGEELFITPKTAGLHVSRILAKLGVAGRGEAAAVAHRLGIGR